jgi:hypothetical protein
MRPTLPTLALLLVLPTGLAAQNVKGTITGTLGLDPANWTILETDEVPSSRWEEAGESYRVTIVGYPEAEQPSPENAITITFTADAGAVEPVAQKARVEIARDGAEPLVAGDQNIDFSLTAFEVEETDIAMAGNLVAAMAPGGSDGLVVEGDDALTFDGNFQATVPRAD